MNEEKNTNTAPQEPEAAAEKLPKEKRTALVRYMAILFVFAFVLVLLSLILQYYRSSQTISELSNDKTSAIARAEQLQSENRDLETAVAKKDEQIEALQDAVQEAQDAQKATQEAADAAAQEAQQKAEEAAKANEQALADRQHVYDALVKLLGDPELRDDPKKLAEPDFAEAVKIVKEGKDKLSDAAWEAFAAFAEEAEISITEEAKHD